eukprot:1039996-Amphidinium_carterae.1
MVDDIADGKEPVARLRTLLEMQDERDGHIAIVTMLFSRILSGLTANGDILENLFLELDSFGTHFCRQ